jgi:hypothetical protein
MLSSSQMNKSELKDFLDEKYFNTTHSIHESDPVQIPHLFTRKEDIEIVGFKRYNWESYHDYQKFSSHD